MGTNFYYKVLPKKEDVKRLHLLVDNIEKFANFDNIKETIDIMESNSIIHLGKRSCGWQFIWDYHYGNYYRDNLNSIKDFLKNSNGVIEDEYGRRFTVDEFFNDEIGDCLYKDKDHCDAWQYHDEHPNAPVTWNISDYEFTSEDGLRFSKEEDFS